MRLITESSSAISRSPALVRILLRERFEILRGVPNARSLGIQVGEDPQNSSAARGPAGKRVHMQQVVALVDREVAAFFFERAKTRKIEIHFVAYGARNFVRNSITCAL